MINLRLMINKWLRFLKGEYVRFRNSERKIKSILMIYADFESILLPEDNVKKEKKNKISLIRINIKNMFLAVIITN